MFCELMPASTTLNELLDRVDPELGQAFLAGLHRFYGELMPAGARFELRNRMPRDHVNYRETLSDQAKAEAVKAEMDKLEVKKNSRGVLVAVQKKPDEGEKETGDTEGNVDADGNAAVKLTASEPLLHAKLSATDIANVGSCRNPNCNGCTQNPQGGHLNKDTIRGKLYAEACKAEMETQKALAIQAKNRKSLLTLRNLWFFSQVDPGDV